MPSGEQSRRQVGTVGGAGRRDRGHGGGLDELRRMRPGIRDGDRLQRVAFVEAGRKANGRVGRPFAGLVGEFDYVRDWRRAVDKDEAGRGGRPRCGS